MHASIYVSIYLSTFFLHLRSCSLEVSTVALVPFRSLHSSCEQAQAELLHFRSSSCILTHVWQSRLLVFLSLGMFRFADVMWNNGI